MTARSPRLTRAAVPPAARELAIGLTVFALYSAVAALPSGGRDVAAAQHGRHVLALERALHIDIEQRLNQSLAAAPPLWRILANYEYAITYVVSAFALLGWLYRRHPERYRVARNSFILINLLGAACFALYPVMPPRLADGAGFVDTVRLGGTWGSWGSPVVDHADQLAAMPSLHVAWALWVSVELARLSARRPVQVLSAVHILVTLYVIMATANHYLLDAAGAVVLVWVCVAVAGPAPSAERTRVPASDAFFLAVESPAAPQHVGGLILLDTSAGTPTRSDLVSAVTAHLDDLPRLRQRLSAPRRWHRPRWEPHPDLDWTWHVTVREAPSAGGRPARDVPNGQVTAAVREPSGNGSAAASHRNARGVSDGPPAEGPSKNGSGAPGAAFAAAVRAEQAGDGVAVGGGYVRARGLAGVVAELQGEVLPRDRPLWRLVLVPDVAPDRAAVIFLMHHVVADGIGVVTHAVGLMEPPLPPLDEVPHRPGPVRRAAAIAVGIAQLAVAGRQNVRLPSSGGAERRFGAVALPLDRVRDVARAHRVRVSDVVLCAVAGGLRRVATLPDDRDATCRVTVPLMLRDPQTPPEGNYTAAVMVDLPVGKMPEAERLARIGRATGRLRSPTRSLAARFVMERVGAVLPPPAHRWFARTVYGRRTFQAVVSNLPGPAGVHRLAGAPITEVFPILPLGPGAPLAVGALSVAGVLGFGVCTDPALADASNLATAADEVIAELWQSTGIPAPTP